MDSMQSAMKQIIYNAFNQSLAQVVKDLPTIVQSGFTCVLLSPMNKFDKYAYQPTQFTVGNSFGSIEELNRFCATCHEIGINVMVDVCLGYLAQVQGYNSKMLHKSESDPKLYKELMNQLDQCFLPQFKSEHILPRYLIQPDGTQRLMWKNKTFPALKIGHPHVIQILSQYLKDLVDCGVDGFRFDSAEMIHRPLLKMYNEIHPSGLNVAEVTLHPEKSFQFQKFRQICAIQSTEPWLILTSIFSNRWITSHYHLSHILQKIGDNDVVCVRDPKLFINASKNIQHLCSFDSQEHANLAELFLIGLGQGRVMITQSQFHSDPHHQMCLMNAIAFHHLCTADHNNTSFSLVAPEEINDRVYCVKRGIDGFFLLNLSDSIVHVSGIPSLAGCDYQFFRIDDEKRYPVIFDETGMVKIGTATTIRLLPKSVSFFCNSFYPANNRPFIYPVLSR